MTNTRTWSWATVLTAGALMAGCGISHPDGDDSRPGEDDVEVEEEREPVLANGYIIESSFVLPQGSLAEQANYAVTFFDMTDGEHDPATWLLDGVEDRLGFPYDTALSAARGALDLDETINELILEVAPTIVVDLVELGDDMNQIAHTLTLRGHLDVRADIDGAPVADITLTHAVFIVDGVRTVMPLADLGIATVSAPTVELLVDGNRLALGEHAMALDYGALVDAGIDHVLIPMRAPEATSLTDWAARSIHCDVIGDVVEDIVEIGSNSRYQDACVGAVDALIGVLLDPLTESTADVVVTGTATLVDSNDDGIYDRIDSGRYTGSMLFDTDATVLDDLSSFTATRR